MMKKDSEIMVRNKYRNLSGKEKKKREYGRNGYHNIYKENKEGLKKYQENYHEAKKTRVNMIIF